MLIASGELGVATHTCSARWTLSKRRPTLTRTDLSPAQTVLSNCRARRVPRLVVVAVVWWLVLGGPTVAWCAKVFPRFAYVANSGDNTVSVYDVDASSGQLRANGYALTGNTPTALAVDTRNDF